MDFLMHRNCGLLNSSETRFVEFNKKSEAINFPAHEISLFVRTHQQKSQLVHFPEVRFQFRNNTNSCGDKQKNFDEFQVLQINFDFQALLKPARLWFCKWLGSGSNAKLIESTQKHKSDAKSEEFRCVSVITTVESTPNKKLQPICRSNGEKNPPSLFTLREKPSDTRKRSQEVHKQKKPERRHLCEHEKAH